MYEIGNDSLRHHVSSFKVNLFLPRLVVCRQPLFQPVLQCGLRSIMSGNWAFYSDYRQII